MVPSKQLLRRKQQLEDDLARPAGLSLRLQQEAGRLRNLTKAEWALRYWPSGNLSTSSSAVRAKREELEKIAQYLANFRNPALRADIEKYVRQLPK